MSAVSGGWLPQKRPVRRLAINRAPPIARAPSTNLATRWAVHFPRTGTQRSAPDPADSIAWASGPGAVPDAWIGAVGNTYRYDVRLTAPGGSAPSGPESGRTVADLSAIRSSSIGWPSHETIPNSRMTRAAQNAPHRLSFCCAASGGTTGESIAAATRSRNSYTVLP